MAKEGSRRLQGDPPSPLLSAFPDSSDPRSVAFPQESRSVMLEWGKLPWRNPAFLRGTETSKGVIMRATVTGLSVLAVLGLSGSLAHADPYFFPPAAGCEPCALGFYTHNGC